MVGCLNKTAQLIEVSTTSPAVDEPGDVVFDVPTPDNPLKPGKPLWANYVRGVIDTFRSRLIVLTYVY